MKIQINDTSLPVDPRFVPVCTLDSHGNPVPLSASGGGGGGGGDASAANQALQIAEAQKVTVAVGSPVSLKNLNPDAASDLISINKGQLELLTRTLDFQSGRTGSEIICDTDTALGDFTAILLLEDTEIAAITSAGPQGIRNANKLVGRSLPAGTALWGVVTGIELSSGCAQLIDYIPEP